MPRVYKLKEYNVCLPILFPFSLWLGWPCTHHFKVFKLYMFLVLKLNVMNLKQGFMHGGDFLCLIQWYENSQKCCVLFKIQMKKQGYRNGIKSFCGYVTIAQWKTMLSRFQNLYKLLKLYSLTASIQETLLSCT